ncbi:MAG: glutamate formimidoyltransferase [Planctomycetota bacterium]|jgi:glutamate formiminotransferase
MERIVQCVPNFSEGKRSDVVQAITDAASVEGVTFLGAEMDPDHNRSVLTFIGSPEAVAEGAFRASAKAGELIDLNGHSGQHPRMGATDVIPFIPVRGCDMEVCAGLAREVGARIGSSLGIPVFLYGEAASREERRNLAQVRKGEFEGLREAMGTDPARAPDFGPPQIHPSAGATAVGARFFLLAFNVNLNTNDVKIAKSIAKRIREASGGLPNVKALGLMLADKGTAQVSMNLTDYRVTSPGKVFGEIRRLAGEVGIEVAESELIGFAPSDAFVVSAADCMMVTGFEPSMILENRLGKNGRCESHGNYCFVTGGL